MEKTNISNIIAFKPKAGTEEHSAQQKIAPLHLKTLCTMISYVANELKLEQETIQAMVVTTMGVPSLGRLQEDDFEDAIKFLLNLLNNHAALH